MLGMWADWKVQYNKEEYLLGAEDGVMGEEELIRFNIFQDNYRYYKDWSESDEGKSATYTLGVNKFSDLTNEEFKTLYTQNTPHFSIHRRSSENEVRLSEEDVYGVGVAMPTSVDWR